EAAGRLRRTRARHGSRCERDARGPRRAAPRVHDPRRLRRPRCAPADSERQGRPRGAAGPGARDRAGGNHRRRATTIARRRARRRHRVVFAPTRPGRHGRQLLPSRRQLPHGRAARDPDRGGLQGRRAAPRPVRDPERAAARGRGRAASDRARGVDERGRGPARAQPAGVTAGHAPAASSGASEQSLSLFQLMYPDVLADPYPLYERLRTTDPVHWDPFLHTWVVTRYEDVDFVLKHFSAARTPTPDQLTELGLSGLNVVAEILVRQMLFLDGRAHARVRNLAASAFTRSRVLRLRSHIEDITRS